MSLNYDKQEVKQKKVYKHDSFTDSDWKEFAKEIKSFYEIVEIDPTSVWSNGQSTRKLFNWKKWMQKEGAMDKYGSVIGEVIGEKTIKEGERPWNLIVSKYDELDRKFEAYKEWKSRKSYGETQKLASYEVIANEMSI